MNVGVIKIDDAILHFEKLHDQGFGWMKEIPNIRDGLNRIEREVIRSLIKSGGSMKAGLLVGDVVSNLVYVSIDEIKEEIINLLNQKYPLVDREFLYGKPYFTSEEIKLTRLGKLYIDYGGYYLKPIIPMYFLQEKIFCWEDVKIYKLSFREVEYYNFLKDILVGEDVIGALKRNIKSIVTRNRNKVSGSEEFIDSMLEKGKAKLLIEGSVEYCIFNNELILYSIPIGMKSLGEFIDACQKKGIEIIDIDVDPEFKIRLEFKNNNDEDYVKEFLNNIGYFIEIEQANYLIDEEDELILGYMPDMINNWLTSLGEERETVLKELEQLIVDSNSSIEEEKEWVSKWNLKRDKVILVRDNGDIKIDNYYSEDSNKYNYGFRVEKESVVFITDKYHIKIEPSNLDKFISSLKTENDSLVIKGAFPIRKNTKEERVFYFVNQKGNVKVTTEKDLATRTSKVVSTSMKEDERIVTILCNDQGFEKGYIAFVTRKGYIKVLHVSELKPKNRASKYVLATKLIDEDEVIQAFMLKESFKEICLKLLDEDVELEVKFKDNEVVQSKLHRGKRIKEIKEIVSVDVVNKDIIADEVIIYLKK